MRIEVTQEDIDKAVHQIAVLNKIAADCCPISQAVHRVGIKAFTGLWEFHCVSGRSFELPEEGIQFRRKFDATRSAVPTTFDIPGLEAELSK